MRIMFVITSAALAGAAAGCNGPDESRVTGTVTFDGRPIPDGWVCFTPDSAKGNVGPQGRARITNGQYDTGAAGGRDVVAGPVRVRIDCFDGKVADGLPSGNPILASYETTVELPRGASAQNFEIPRVWGEKKFAALPP
jgi:hypothetical protein